ncbi:toprim domain-containing protein [Thiothrix nivea]|uniref:Toprim domain-containing protein n=1 Tax=Thiothrix nivea (strain ATCC 35100 / DSM 5205 / JP2) TaxID=870187 RepID=A0A656HMH0_THINJ|nr:toprim domain-containing protein [Thiothrix nivea]EIJ36225.1 hypothetical protein Thini_3722 [Thiothrix nivea DSM 5205]
MKHAPKSTGEMLDSLRSAMLAAIGNAPATLQATGKLERFDTARRGDKAGWYACHLTRWGMVARFGDWREGYAHKWSSFEESSLSRSDLAELKRIQHQQEQERQAEQSRRQNAARDKAISIWCNAEPAGHTHPYLERKQVQAHGIRQSLGNLVIPITDLSGNLHNLQIIKPDGAKRFLKGGRKRGLSFLFGELAGAHGVIICEGWATGASLHEAYRLPVLVAFDAGSLLPVAQAFRRRFLNIPITLCADNDRKTPGNPGLTKAREVSAQVPGVTLIVPEFTDNAPLSLSDFNDAVNFYRLGVAA